VLHEATNQGTAQTKYFSGSLYFQICTRYFNTSDNYSESLMKPLKRELIKEKILSVIKGGDILFIVPPFVTVKTPILGPHTLQAISRQLGYEAHVLHLNLLLSSIIGIDLHERVSYGQPFWMLGERLFARSAYGLPPLGKSPELCLDPAASVFGNHQGYRVEEFEYKYLNPSDFDLDVFLKVEEICHSFIKEVTQTIVPLHYKMIGCSTSWEQNSCSIALLNGIKKSSPDTITLIGGSNCEGEMAEGIASLSDSIDYIFSGEGEIVFTDFLKQYSTGTLPSQRIFFGAPLKDLDTLPLPDYESYLGQRDSFLSKDSSEKWTVGYETSRGCWWGKCYFCGLNGCDRGRFRQKTVKKTVTDLEEIDRIYPDKSVIMADKVMPVSYQKELLPTLCEKRDSLPSITYEQRSNLSLKDIIHLSDANVITIKPGIEALSTGLLKLMNKGISVRQNILLLRNAASLSMYVDWNMLWGFPGDKADHYEEILKIIPLIHHFCPPAVFRHICIDRFSPYFDKARDFEIENLRPWAVYKMSYPEWADVHKLAYRFIGDYPSEAHDNIQLIKTIAEELTLWKKQWKTSRLIITPFGGSHMMIYDNRNIHKKTITHVVTYEQAKEIMTSCKYTGSETLTWALEQKLGVIADSWYIPLVTASSELLLKFEKN